MEGRRNPEIEATDGSMTPPAASGVPPASGQPAGARIVHSEAPPAARDIRDTIVIKEGDLFLLTDLEGNAPLGNRNGLGLYYQDTRFLSGYELAIQHLRPTILVSTVRPPAFEAQVLTNPSLVTAEGQFIHEQTIQVRRYRLLQPSRLTESLTFKNLNLFPLALDVSLRLEADFADMFEVRGFATLPEGRGQLYTVEYRGGTLVFRYNGRDGVRRVTTASFDPRPARVDGGMASYELALPAHGSQRITVTVQLSSAPVGQAARAVSPRQARVARAGYREWLEQQVRVETSNRLFDRILEQARDDLNLLMSGQDDFPYAAAGVPWYATVFGRDSIITALQILWASPALARQTLHLLARFQGRSDDAWRDEEPGKIMHELRRGELARLGRVPFTPYYGTIDATPLWVLLLAEYYRATGDLELVEQLRSELNAALVWIDRYGDFDRDGFVEYRCRSGEGLVNQGWKDSWDGITQADGTLPDPPIALVEVQAYVYAAKRGAAWLYRALGEEPVAERLEREASRLGTAFDETFWMPERDFYSVALDGGKRQVTSITSNPGHALWCGIVPRERAVRVVARLMSKDMFSGWGIRTLSSREPRYNPAGYHTGTVWPHDNSLIVLGLKRYGEEGQALRVITGMYEAAHHFPSFRMPELFCGFARSAFGIPVRYPVACSPQAWAAVSWSAFLQAMLGLKPDAPAGELRIVRPMLPPWLDWVRIRRLRVGSGELDLRYERIDDHTAVDVAAIRGNIHVTIAGEWERTYA